MALPTKPQESSNNSIDKGVYLSQGRVLSVIDKSTHPAFPAREKTIVNKKDKNGNSRPAPVDLLLEVNYVDEGGEERSMLLFGDYQKDFVSGNIQGWKAKGNKVSEFLFTLLPEETIAKGVNDDKSSMNDSLFKALEGVLFKEVRYAKGIYQKDGENKVSTTTWRFFSFDTDINAIIEEWEKAKRLIKNYKPDAVDVVSPQSDGNAAFNEAFPFGANVDADPI